MEGSSTKPKSSRGNVYDFDEALDLLATCDLEETEVGLLDRIEEEREEESDGQLSEGSDAEDPLDDDDEEDKPQSEEDHDDETETAATESAARGEQSVAEVSDSEENETRADDEDDIPIAVLQKRWEERLKKAPSVAKRVLKRNDIPSHLKSFKAKINDGRCADKKSRVEIEWSTADELKRWEVKCDVGDKPKLSQEAAYLKDYDSPMEYFNFVITPDIIEK